MSAFDELEVKNAIITCASIRVDRGFILTAYLHLDYGAAGQSFGGYVLGGIGGEGIKAADHAAQPNICGHFIARVLDIVGVDNWDDLKGKTVRVRGTYGRVESIGHIVKDKWFSPEADFSAFRKEAAQ